MLTFLEVTQFHSTTRQKMSQILPTKPVSKTLLLAFGNILQSHEIMAYHHLIDRHQMKPNPLVISIWLGVIRFEFQIFSKHITYKYVPSSICNALENWQFEMFWFKANIAHRIQLQKRKKKVLIVAKLSWLPCNFSKVYTDSRYNHNKM